MEYNKITRKYHGHLSGVYSLALHPTLDLLVTGGRDSVARVWDIRTKHQIHVLGGHNGAVGSLLTNSVDPQIITGSYDSTIKVLPVMEKANNFRVAMGLGCWALYANAYTS